MDVETAGQRIARARRRRGLSQAVLAGLVGRSESWLSQVERGRRGVDSVYGALHLAAGTAAAAAYDGTMTAVLLEKARSIADRT